MQTGTAPTKSGGRCFKHSTIVVKEWFLEIGFKIKMPLFTLDSTTINLSLSQFHWARYRKRKGAIKLHTFLDHNGCLPCYVSLTDGKRHDLTFAKTPEIGLPDLPPHSILNANRGYIDYRWLYSLHCKGTTFIIG